VFYLPEPEHRPALVAFVACLALALTLYVAETPRTLDGVIAAGSVALGSLVWGTLSLSRPGAPRK
jgi:hypothetical protein